MQLSRFVHSARTMESNDKKDGTEATASHVQEPALFDEKIQGETREVATASVALAAAVAEEKPNIWAPSMIKLYGIMAIGYLISTMNGFGTMHPSLYRDLKLNSWGKQTVRSWAQSTP